MNARAPSSRPSGRLLLMLLAAAEAVLPNPSYGQTAGDTRDPLALVGSAYTAEQAGRKGQARRLYLQAADSGLGISDWLLRRAALLTPDPAARAAIIDRIALPVVRARLLETEALAREGAGDLAGAATRYDSLGRVVDATRVRLRLARTLKARRALQTALVESLPHLSAASDIAAAMELIRSAGRELPVDQALAAARVAAGVRLASQAVPLFQRGIAAHVATPEDHLAYAASLAQLGRHRAVLRALDRIESGTPQAPEAVYLRAVSLSRIRHTDEALALLHQLAAEPEPDSAVITKALLLAGDIRWREGDVDGARREWVDLTRRYPTSQAAGRAGFQAGLVAWEAGRYDQAAVEWEQVHRLSRGTDAVAAGYWAGRAFEGLGAEPRARDLWESVMAHDSLSYYAVASAGRLGVAPWSPAPAPDRFETFPDLDAAAARMATLQTTDLSDELGWERDWLVADNTTNPERLLAAGDILRREGQASAAVLLGRRALKAGAEADARTYRLIFPLLHADELNRQAEEAGLDPNVVAALIRQESIWEVQARSRAGALGLMQVLPSTGREVARRLGMKRWRADLLFDPVINLRLGTHYFAAALHRFGGDLAQALAAYNAGPSRVNDWATGPAASDPELFVERISISETRNYVRIIQRNLALYRVLYGS